jgi:2-isopropylmalate synthase
MGEVSMRVQYGQAVVAGKGSSTDIVQASAKAYLNCLNRHLFAVEGSPRKGPAKKKRIARK